MSAREEITIEELTRNTPSGRYTYAMYRGRVARRVFRRGRPSYEVLDPGAISLRQTDNITTRVVNVRSQVARALMAEMNR